MTGLQCVDVLMLQPVPVFTVVDVGPDAAARHQAVSKVTGDPVHHAQIKQDLSF
jgi:hypothetical protein